ncbi:hypothetical protein QW131_33230 [Roseibium salinum]|nr:hypothetical protein [Roseibium salinum]
MPHFQIDYSANLEERLDIPGLLAVLRDAAVETGVFPAGRHSRSRDRLHPLGDRRWQP